MTTVSKFTAAPKPTVAKAVTFAPITAAKITPRMIINAVEGWGKTTALAHSPKPVVLMARDETGYQTLLGSGLAPQNDGAIIETWPQLIDALDSLVASDYQTVGLDALAGFERLCHEEVCRRDFGGDWSERGFGSFQKGYEQSVRDWNIMLARLDKLHASGKIILILSHSKVAGFRNPAGADFDRYVADCHAKTWAATARWADAVLFGKFDTMVDLKQQDRGNIQKKGKGIGGAFRVLHTERRDAWDAKNRYGLPAQIDIPDDPSAVWSTIWNSIKKGA